MEGKKCLPFLIISIIPSLIIRELTLETIPLSISSAKREEKRRLAKHCDLCRELTTATLPEQPYSLNGTYTPNDIVQEWMVLLTTLQTLTKIANRKVLVS